MLKLRLWVQRPKEFSFIQPHLKRIFKMTEKKATPEAGKKGRDRKSLNSFQRHSLSRSSKILYRNSKGIVKALVTGFEQQRSGRTKPLNMAMYRLDIILDQDRKSAYNGNKKKLIPAAA